MTTTRRGRPALQLDEHEILRAAVEVFAAGGLSGSSLQQVAERCGVAKTTLHNRFGSKQALFDRAVEHERTILTTLLVDAYEEAKDEPALDQVRHGYRAFFAYARERPAAFRLLFGDDATDAADSRRVVVEAVSRTVAHGFGRAGLTLGPSSEIIAAVAVGAGESVARHYVHTPDVELDALTDLVVELVAKGISNIDPRAAVRVDESASGAPRRRRRGARHR